MTTAEVDPAIEKRRAYQRQWYKDNKHKHAKYQIRYWKKKLEEYENENDDEK